MGLDYVHAPIAITRIAHHMRGGTIMGACFPLVTPAMCPLSWTPGKKFPSDHHPFTIRLPRHSYTPRSAGDWGVWELGHTFLSFRCNKLSRIFRGTSKRSRRFSARGLRSTVIGATRRRFGGWPRNQFILSTLSRGFCRYP